MSDSGEESYQVLRKGQKPQEPPKVAMRDSREENYQSSRKGMKPPKVAMGDSREENHQSSRKGMKPQEPPKIENRQEEHILELLGFPLIITYIYRPTAPTLITERIKQVRKNMIGVVLAVFVAVFLFYNRPRVLPDLINASLRSCPEKSELNEIRKNLEQCESTIKIASNSLGNCSVEKMKLEDMLKTCSGEKQRIKDKLNEAEKTISSLEISLAEAERNNRRLEQMQKDLQSNIDSLKVEKDDLGKKVDDTEIMLGKCRNKNMDHEIEKADVLRKLQKAEKELKNCR